MTVRELREKYLAFFESKGHRRFPSGSLIPYDVTGRLDESLLFNGAGMIQFKPYFRGVAQPDHPRLTTCQKCVRTGDIDEVGDATHLTFFEMLGNFSFGDYFKTEAIRFSWEFLTSPEWLGLDPNRLSFTIFEDDDEAESAWRACGATHIFRLGEETNYWPAGAFTNGPPGPCGPNSEMFYWVSSSEPPPGPGYTREDWIRDEGAGKWVEIWNDVFIQFEWQGDPAPGGKGYVKTGMPELPFRSIDTGMGLERTSMVLSGKTSVYDTDAFTGILASISSVARPSQNVVGPSRSPVSETVSVSEEADLRIAQGRHLPHWRRDGATYFVTFRLADSVPSSKREEWQSDRDFLKRQDEAGELRPNERREMARVFAERVDQYLDSGAGDSLMKRPEAASVVANALRYFDGDRYALHAWVVMPNHVHALVTPLTGFDLSSILHTWKSYTAKELNHLFDRQGDVWMDEGYNRIVRDEEEFTAFREYIVRNPAKANLNDWPYVFSAETETVSDTGDRDGPTTNVTSAHRVIADHARTATFCIGDGILPGNSGRGYVLRRLIRRAVLKGVRELNTPQGFLAQVGATVIEEYGEVYRELREQRTVILETLRNEEALFRNTLKAGTDRLSTLLEGATTLSGDAAFNLYDTYGFPLEITQELAREAGVEVDTEGYETALAAAQARSRGATDMDTVYGGVGDGETEGAALPTEFLGYASCDGPALISAIKRVGPKTYVALDRTPFYAESGGQIGDRGELRIGDRIVPVLGTTKASGVFWHEVPSADGLEVGAEVVAQVDAPTRRRTQAHHTATHLLHLALRETLGTHATQAGSYVGPDRLRFDFTHGAALTPEQRAAIEARVNDLAAQNANVTTYADISPDEAKSRGAMALFGEKYGDKVRMVEVGDSRELCGGTHVRTAAECFPFRILSESSAQSGVRRIEAVAGLAAMELAKAESTRLTEAAQALKSRPDEILRAIERLQTELKDERAKREKAERAALSGSAPATADQDIEGVTLIVRDLGETDPKSAQSLVDDLAAGKPMAVTVAATADGGKVLFVAKVGTEATARGAHAGNLLKELARIAGGGGGGRAEFATAGGKDPAKIPDALAAAPEVLRAQLKGG